MSADRIVLDTNVLISAALTGSPRRVVDLVRVDNGVLQDRGIAGTPDRYKPALVGQ